MDHLGQLNTEIEGGHGKLGIAMDRDSTAATSRGDELAGGYDAGIW